MTKEEQIEEMAQEILHAGVVLDGVDFVYGLFDEDDHFRRLARKLYAIGYRKADEVRKETAREILQRLLFERTTFVDNYGEVSYAVFIEKIKEVAAEYGVEVEE